MGGCGGYRGIDWLLVAGIDGGLFLDCLRVDFGAIMP